MGPTHFRIGNTLIFVVKNRYLDAGNGALWFEEAFVQVSFEVNSEINNLLQYRKHIASSLIIMQAELEIGEVCSLNWDVIELTIVLIWLL